MNGLGGLSCISVSSGSISNYVIVNNHNARHQTSRNYCKNKTTYKYFYLNDPMSKLLMVLLVIAAVIHGVSGTAVKTDNLSLSNISVRSCHSSVPSKTELKNFEALTNVKLIALKNSNVVFIQSAVINVYFHVVSCSNGSGDLTRAVLLEQLEILNRSFIGSGFSFIEAGHDVTVDDAWCSGLMLGSTAETIMKQALRKGGDNALNIYTANLANSTLGWATFPHSCFKDAWQDGVVVAFDTLPGVGSGAFSLGLTVVHEVGHWLGLYHTFQDGCHGPGDYVTDTPAVASPNHECLGVVDSCPGDPGYDLVDNFMDHTRDSCMKVFTKGQISRMWEQYNVYRVNHSHLRRLPKWKHIKSKPKFQKSSDEKNPKNKNRNKNKNKNNHKNKYSHTTNNSIVTRTNQFNSNSALPSDLNPKKLVYVCITGQLSRLELRNKITMLFAPLHDMGFNIFVGLAMTTDGHARYVNNNNGDKMNLYTSISQVENVLMNVTGVVGVKYFSKVNEQNPNVYMMNEFYKYSVQHQHVQINITHRAEGNSRQFKLLQYCDYPEITSQTSMFVRMREDTFIDRLDLKPVVIKVLRGHVVTTKCDAWRGMNDKIAFGPSDRASDFFRLPFEYYLNFNKVIRNYNPEQLYRNCYENGGFKLSPTKMFVVTKALTTVVKMSSNETDTSKTMCTVWGNSFKRYSKFCPRSGISGLYNYTAECWAPQNYQLHDR